MKKGFRGTGTVERVDFPNKGIAVTDDGDRVIVKNTIPGQKVEFVVNKVKHQRAEGRLMEVIEKSPLETEEPCPHFGMCGGCTYQTVPYEKQLDMKLTQVKKLISDAIGTEKEAGYEFIGIHGSPKKSEYRNKMEFSFGDEYKDGPLALGMHKRGSFYDLVTVSDCQIVDEDFRTILKATLDYFSKNNIPYFHRATHKGYLRHLLVRKATKTGEIIVDLVTSTQTEGFNEEELLAGFRYALLTRQYGGRFKGVLHTKNDSVADVVKNEGTDVLYGDSYFYEELLGLKFKITPFSFFQTNSLGAEVLYETAREFILGDDKDSLNGKTVYDLYSGTGTIAQLMAPVCKEVVGVEIVEEAVCAAKENAALNGLDNCKFIAGDVLKVLDEIEEKPDYIILDPPRDGIHPKAIGRIIDYDVENMVYISCKPTSLARDLQIFMDRGYRVEKICCVDMFPNTYHVETVVLLSQHRDKNTCLDERGSRQIEMQASRLASLLAQKPDDTIEIDLDLDELDATSAELKATYQEIKDYVLKEFGLKVSSLYISQVKRKCGIEVGENYNLPKSENARVPQCPKEKEDAIKAALKYYAMI